MEPRLKGELKYDAGNKQPWWVRVSYTSNGKIHSRTETYATKRAALNALRALADGVLIEEGND